MEISAKGKGRQEDPEASTRGIRWLDKARLNVKGKPSREGRTPQSQPNGKDKYPREGNPSPPDKHHLAYSFFFFSPESKIPQSIPSYPQGKRQVVHNPTRFTAICQQTSHKPVHNQGFT